MRVWKILHEIPFGQVRTYGQVAAAAGSPRASRAVGQACGANPIVLFIPCHRVIASGGVGGFGAGLEWKRRLLALEDVSVIPPRGAEPRRSDLVARNGRPEAVGLRL
jgi:O-6-methylguanine DNA methyltransferase